MTEEIVEQPQLEEGPLLVDYHLGKHENSLANIEKLQEHYKDNPKVDFTFVDNSLGKDKAEITSLEKIKEKPYLSEDAKNNLHESVENQLTAGSITPEQYTALKGNDSRGVQQIDSKREGGNNSAGNGGKPQQSGQPRQDNITPHKEVKDTLQTSIDEVSQLHDLDTKEANALYGLKGKNVEKELSKATGETERIYDSLYDKGFIGYAEEGIDRLLDPKGEVFIKALDARQDTRKNVKAGMDLFPKDASIPEVQNVKLSKAEENRLESTFAGGISKSVQGNVISRRILRSESNYPVYKDYGETKK